MRFIKKARGWWTLETGVAGENVGVTRCNVRGVWGLIHPRLPSDASERTFSEAKARALRFVANQCRE